LLVAGADCSVLKLDAALALVLVLRGGVGALVRSVTL
jgi:hypothetical protein